MFRDTNGIHRIQNNVIKEYNETEMVGSERKVQVLHHDFDTEDECFWLTGATFKRQDAAKRTKTKDLSRRSPFVTGHTAIHFDAFIEEYLYD